MLVYQYNVQGEGVNDLAEFGHNRPCRVPSGELVRRRYDVWGCEIANQNTQFGRICHYYVVTNYYCLPNVGFSI
jgi:hypothetical protein